MINQNMARRGLMGVGSGDDVLTGTAIVDEEKKVTIPLTETKKNFMAAQDLESASSADGALVPVMFRVNWASSERVYRTRVVTWSTTPTLDVSTTPAAFVTETPDSITIRCTNSNTTGLLIPGAAVRYIVW